MSNVDRPAGAVSGNRRAERLAGLTTSLSDNDQPAQPSSLTAPLGVLLVTAAMLGLIAASRLLGLSPSPATWYLARASGLTLYLLCWWSVVSGLGLTTKLLGIGSRGTVWQSHRFTTELAYVFLTLHLLSLAVDPTVPLGFVGVLIPFSRDVRQPWTDIGILAGYGMIILTMSFGLRRLIGQKGWRLLHFGAFPLWVMALVHGLGAGSDAQRPWALLLYLATAGVVVFLTAFRLLRLPLPFGRPASVEGQGKPAEVLGE
jgi:predicted ferric reductase